MFHLDRLIEANAQRLRRSIARRIDEMQAACEARQRAWASIDSDLVTPEWFRDNVLHHEDAFHEWERLAIKEMRELMKLIDDAQDVSVKRPLRPKAVPLPKLLEPDTGK